MPKLGLKLWSADIFHIEPALELYRKGVFEYVELYIVPGTAKEYLDIWKGKRFPFFLHAPHSYSGLNLSLRNFELQNRPLIKEIEAFMEVLNPRGVIFHPGIDGSIDETIQQVHKFRREFPALFDMAVLENKPKIGINGEICVGASPEEMEKLLEETRLGFCLDVGHAICYAAWAGIEWEEVIDQFMKLAPDVFHLSDGDVNSRTDSHLNYGDGNFNLRWIIKKLPSDAYVSIETNKNSKLNLNEFERDVIYFKELYLNSLLDISR